MKKTIKTGIAALLMLSVVSCTKEKISSPSNATIQSSEQSDATTAFSIGQSYHGGIIFYIDSTGKHGLIAATADQGTGIAWKKGANKVTGATATAIRTGLSNTNKIVASLGSTGNYAALICYNYSVGNFKNWYLPSKDELNLMYQQRAAIGNLASGNYWSSSEVAKSTAWDQEFGGGFQFADSKSFTLNVRAIESF